jgi:hypothetical protein
MATIDGDISGLTMMIFKPNSLSFYISCKITLQTASKVKIIIIYIYNKNVVDMQKQRTKKGGSGSGKCEAFQDWDIDERTKNIYGTLSKSEKSRGKQRTKAKTHIRQDMHVPYPK